MLRPFPVYPSHQLREGTAATRGRKTRNGAADAEAERRGVIRGINEEISRYYKLPPGQTKWCCSELISEGKRDQDHSQEQFPLLAFCSAQGFRASLEDRRCSHEFLFRSPTSWEAWKPPFFIIRCIIDFESYIPVLSPALIRG